MRYNKNGEEILHRLGSKASFSEVLTTIRCLGYDLSSESKFDYVKLSSYTKDLYGRLEYSYRVVYVPSLIEWLNQEMESRGIIQPIIIY